MNFPAVYNRHQEKKILVYKSCQVDLINICTIYAVNVFFIAALCALQKWMIMYVILIHYKIYTFFHCNKYVQSHVIV